MKTTSNLQDSIEKFNLLLAEALANKGSFLLKDSDQIAQKLEETKDNIIYFESQLSKNFS